jgi:hypothetical protein
MNIPALASIGRNFPAFSRGDSQIFRHLPIETGKPKHYPIATDEYSGICQ